ncbi:MAG: deoxyribodipyrimidine photo-lyase [Candidatus Sericytochromatia bacterium]
MTKISIFWFRRDLRINDNSGFYNLLNDKNNILPLFIFDKDILDKLSDNDKRVNFIYLELKKMKFEFEKLESSFLILYGNVYEIYEKIIKEYDIDSVYTNHDYEPYALDRDNKIKELLEKNNIIFKTFKDQVIFEKKEILNQQDNIYTVYTPYKNKWKEKVLEQGIINYPSETYLSKLYKIESLNIPSLKDMGFNEIETIFPNKEIDLDIIKDYDKYRNIPSLDKTSRVSLYLRFGTISIRECVNIAYKYNEIWLNELIWREFFMMILFNFPHVVNNSFRKEYDNIQWLNNNDDFKKWCEGKTGYPIVDAGMRELNETGYMHNRVRLITASFLTKDLLIDWRWGERYFSEKLLDYELSSNNGNWQWCAGTGCDAAPYFRVFNPYMQTEKFDPDYKYIKRWVPEYNTSKYPKPMIDHKFARNRALETYKQALNRNK